MPDEVTQSSEQPSPEETTEATQPEAGAGDPPTQAVSEEPAQSESEPPPPAVDPFDNDFADYTSILAEIPGDNPCGDGRAARYEPVYDEIDGEIGKLLSLDPEVFVDWGKVKILAAEFLTKHAIDLLVVCYFCHSMFVKHGYPGLIAGFATVNAMMEKYWDNLFPPVKRVAGRVAAIEWLGARLTADFKTRKPGKSDLKIIHVLADQLEKLEATMHEKFTENSPDLAEVRREINKIVQEQRRAEEEIKAAREKQKQQVEARAKQSESLAQLGGMPAGGTGEAAGGASTSVSFESDAAVKDALNAVQGVYKNIASYFRDKDLKDPRGYYFNRCAMWMTILELPPEKNGKTLLREPGKAQALAKAVEEGNADAVLKNVETALSSSRYWLGGNRLAWKALEKLGPAYEPCQAVVASMLGAVTAQYPALMTMKYATGNALVDDETKMWMDEVLAAGSGGDGASLGGGSGGEPWKAVYSEAKSMAVGGKFAEGLKLFKQGQASAGSKRNNFVWRIFQSRFTLEAGQLELAIGQLEALDHQAQDFGLDEWEPDLSVEVARLLLRCYSNYLKKLKKPLPGLSEKMEHLYRRICRLDINTALKIEDKPWQV